MTVTPSSLEANGGPRKVVWYRSTICAAFILGVCNFGAPGLWVAMNSLGAGGQQRPYLVNAANALVFGLMIITAFVAPTILNKIGIKWSIFFGGIGFVPYLAGLYMNNTHGTEWLVLFGAACCGLSAGLFWAVEAAVAIAYPEPDRMGLCVGIWISFRVAGQIVGGAISLGLNADRAGAGSINPVVYLVFVALTAVGPFVAFLLPSPEQLQRRDGVQVDLRTKTSFLKELKATTKLFLTPRFLLVTPLIWQAVFPQPFTNTFLALHFTVRSRALGSFISAIACIAAAQILGRVMDVKRWSLKNKTRWSFVVIVTLQGGWWVWATVLEANFPTTEVIDWNSPYFARTFPLYIFLGVGYQLNYMYLYFLIENLATEPREIIRLAGLLRVVESASQTASYGIGSIESFKLLGVGSLNFGLWAVAIPPAWFVIRRVGVDFFGRGAFQAVEEQNEKVLDGSETSSVDEDVKA